MGTTQAFETVRKRDRISQTGRGTGVLVRLDEADLTVLDRFCAAHNGISRPEALRVGLTALGIAERPQAQPFDRETT